MTLIWSKLRKEIHLHTNRIFMKKWLVALCTSLMLSILGVFYFVEFVAKDACLDSGGSWMGAKEGCAGALGYTPADLISPLGVTIFFAIVVSISSMFIQLQKILFKKS